MNEKGRDLSSAPRERRYAAPSRRIYEQERREVVPVAESPIWPEWWLRNRRDGCSNLAYGLLALLHLVVVNALYVAAKFATVGARRAQICPVVEESPQLDRHFAACQSGSTPATIGLGMYSGASGASWLYGLLEHLLGVSKGALYTVGTVLAVGVKTHA